MKYQISIPETTRSKDINPRNRPKSQRSKGSSLRRSLFIFLLFNLILVSVGAIVLLGAPILFVNDNLCLTEQCINTASRILEALDRTTEPCDDFYQYACGGWIKANRVPDWTTSWDRLSYLRESLMQEMRHLLEADENLQNDTVEELSSITKAKAMYRMCMNTGKLESQGVESVKIILKNVGLSENPSAAANNTVLDWIFTIARVRRLLGISILYGFNVAEDVRNSSQNKIVIEQVSPGFRERYLLQPEKFVAEIQYYKKYITSMLKAYTNETVENFATDIIKFSTQIAKVMTPAQLRRSPGHLFHEITLEECFNGPGFDNDTWRTVNWTRYMEIVFNDTDVVLEHNKDTAILLDLPYMQRMSMLLKNTKQHLLEKFLWWNVFSTIAPLTLAKFRILGFEFSQHLLGLRTSTSRWKICTNNVNTNFGLVLSHLYVRSHFPKLYSDKALEILENIRQAFEKTVKDLDWMDTVTREKTLTKLHAIRTFVGYPEWIMNITQLDIHYRQAHIVKDDLFKTYLKLTNISIKRNLESIRKKPDRNRWVATATTVNAFYSATLNSVTFPAGILKPPFYGNGIAAIDYGSIGAIMGHEITHGFDDQGRRYDEQGNLKQWWSLATLNHYYNKVKCIIEQYSNYTVPELGESYFVHGYNTQGENIADNGGFRAAFEGYKDWKTQMSSTPQRLPGLPHITTDQLFFLGFAQIWCGNSTMGALRNKLIDAVHSPNRIRVHGTLRNSKEFSESWKCPLGSSMNPKNKCVLW